MWPGQAWPTAGTPEASALRARLHDAPLTRLIGLAGQSVGHTFRKVFAEEDGLSPGAAAVLTALASGQGRGLDTGTPGRATHSQLAQRCLITPATLTGVVSTLEKAGYVRRERDQEDRRVVWLLLTDTGRERAGAIAGRAAAANESMLRNVDLDPGLEKTLREFLITVIQNNFAVAQEVPPVPSPDCPPGSDAPSATQSEPPSTDRPQPGRPRS
jgi:MarR family transcriptional regulator, organic hydroperoxide resistance regulator